MEDTLPEKSPKIRDEFRSAFRHAALKQDIREDRIHRARIEADVEETKQAAQQARTMAGLAAINTSISLMRR